MERLRSDSAAFLRLAAWVSSPGCVYSGLGALEEAAMEFLKVNALAFQVC